MKHHLEKLLGRPVRVVYTENTRVMLTIREERGCLQVRAHQIFQEAPEDVARAVAGMYRGEAEARCKVREYVKRNEDLVRRPPHQSPRRRLNPAGRVYNLQEVHDRLNEEFFGGALKAFIGWGRNGRGKTSIKFGSYCPADRTIVIHPRLDDARVPPFFLEFVVYHELCHHYLHLLHRSERRGRLHSREFRELEARHPRYREALRWEKQELDRLLARGRSQAL